MGWVRYVVRVIGRLRSACGWTGVRYRRPAVVAMLAVHMLAVSARAQQTGNLPEEESGLLQWCIAAGIVLVICITAFLNPKRSHLN